jgi:hypothetical protein
MSLEASLVLYLLMGAGVAVAVGLTPGEARWFRVACSLFFWPLFVPLLLSGSSSTSTAIMATAPTDDLTAAIRQADAELQAALDSLDGWAGHVREREEGRIRELRTAWVTQADRIREMDRLLCRPDAPSLLPLSDDRGVSERVLQLERARRLNRERLVELRSQAHDDLMGSLAWVRELASMIHLARFTGEPVARAEELVTRLAAAMEELSARNRVKR